MIEFRPVVRTDLTGLPLGMKFLTKAELCWAEKSGTKILYCERVRIKDELLFERTSK